MPIVHWARNLHQVFCFEVAAPTICSVLCNRMCCDVLMLPTPNTYPVSEPPLSYSPVPHGVEIPNRVFVGGLAYNTTELELKNLFNQFGHVRDSKIITDRQGISKGYGFVTFDTAEEALKVQEQGCLYYNEKKLNVSKAIRKQGGQYQIPNQEYISGQRSWFDGMMVPENDALWMMKPPHSQGSKQPFGPVMFSMYPPTTSQAGYHGNPTQLFSPAHYYPFPPVYNGYYSNYLQHSNNLHYSHPPHKDHYNESLTSGEESVASEEQDGDLAELEAQTRQLSLKEVVDNDKPDHSMYKRKRPSRLRKSPHHFPPHSPFHPAAHQLMGSPTYAPLLPTPHLIQPLPPRYLQQQHGMLPKSLLN